MKVDDNNIEFNKLQGFDVLEKLPEEKLVNTYNEQFYSSLSSMKFISCTIPDENKQFYRFEQNENAPVTTTTVQILKSYEDLFIENELVKKIFRNIRQDIVSLNASYDNFDTNIIDNLRPEIKAMERKLQTFLVDQKTENFKLIKEIGILEKEKNEIQTGILAALERLSRLEASVGVKERGLTYGDENKGTMSDNELSQRFNVVDSKKI